MAMSVGTLGPRSSNLNATPLIDGLLTLFVIFMIITPMSPKGDRALIPQPPPKHAKQQVNNRSVVLQVLVNGQDQPELKINEQPVNWQDLTARVVDIYNTRGQRVMFVKADKDVPWQDVATVIDDAHYAGVGQGGIDHGKDRGW